MFALGIRSPHTTRSVDPPRPLDLSGAVGRARLEAGVSGAFLSPPFEFHLLEGDACQMLSLSTAAGDQMWILVTVQRAAEDGHRAHLRERCLTAAQRFMLHLACDGIDNAWVSETPDAEALQAAGVALGDREPVGLIRCEGGG